MNALENATLAELEAIIDRGRPAFIEVGAALLAIRRRKLYKPAHATFREYLRGRWHMGKSQAYRLMEEARLLAENVPQGPLPENERQARELIASIKSEGKMQSVVEMTLEDADENNPKLQKFIAAREKSRAAGKDACEVNFWVCLVFQSHKQKMEYLDQMKVGTLYGLYVDGQAMAAAQGITVTPCRFARRKITVESRLKELALGEPTSSDGK
jgi:hypothetical protein